jgi:hypothetical protein
MPHVHRRVVSIGLTILVLAAITASLVTATFAARAADVGGTVTSERDPWDPDWEHHRCFRPDTPINSPC